jgi:ribosomal protein L40E
MIEEKVICDKCKAENAKNAKFCSSCGNSLVERACSSCNTLNPYDAKFCTNCGNDLGR